MSYANTVAPPRILVIDDNESIHADFRKIFAGGEAATDLDALDAELFGPQPVSHKPAFQIDYAFQGQQGFAMTQEAKQLGQPYALAFVDVRMPPGWDGIETSLRLWATDPRLQVVICTAYSDLSWERTIEKLGVGDRFLILKKPFDIAEVRQLALLLSVKWALARQGEARLEDLEQRVSERTAELFALNAELREAVARALDASKAKSQFLANVSHEIRTPLNGIIGMAQLALQEDLTGELRQSVDAILVSGENLLAIVNDVLDFSKIEAGRMGLEVRPFDLHQMVGDVFRLQAVRGHQKGLELTLNIEGEVPRRTLGDSLRCGQVLANIIANAVKFTSQGEVAVSVAMRHGAVCFEVRDSGVGIPQESLQAIFEAFSQADGTTSRRFGGTGLGLSISRDLVHQMGGTIEVESAVGAGSIFRWSLPLATAPMPSDGAAPDFEPALLVNEVSGPTRALRVLLAEDNEINARVAERMLERLGHQVIRVSNGQEALDLLERETVDLVLMDVQMPVVDGLAATRALRQREQSNGRHLTVLALTANALTEDVALCRIAGMDGHLSKPINFERLRSALSAQAQAGTPRT